MTGPHPDKVPTELAAALARFAAEHGTPNKVSPKELHELYRGPYPLDAGWHWRYNRAAVERACAARGIVIGAISKPPGSAQKLIEITST